MGFKSFMTVDPGVQGTGIAYWGEKASHPSATYCLKSPGSKDSWCKRAKHITMDYQRLVQVHWPGTIYIEEPAVWMSPRGLASANQGDILKLSQIIGMLIYVTMRTTGTEPIMLPVRKWKGQLPKSVVIQRVKRLTGLVYPDHIADAVGMGMHVMGKL